MNKQDIISESKPFPFKIFISLILLTVLVYTGIVFKDSSIKPLGASTNKSDSTKWYYIRDYDTLFHGYFEGDRLKVEKY